MFFSLSYPSEQMPLGGLAALAPSHYLSISGKRDLGTVQADYGMRLHKPHYRTFSSHYASCQQPRKQTAVYDR